MKVVIVIPTYNEAGNIEQFIKALRKACKHFSHHETHFLVVDDNSPDGTGKIVKKLKKKYNNLYLLTGKKRGLGQAYLRGMDYAVDKLQADLLFEIDADFQHDPLAVGNFVKKIDDGFDFVIGSRYIKGGSIPSNWGLNRKILSKVGNFLVRFLLLTFSIHDWTSGYRAVKSWVYKQAREDLVDFNGYTFQVAFLNKAKEINAKITEVPIQFGKRKYGKSKIGGEYVKNLLFYLISSQMKKYQRFIKFGIVGFVGYLVNAFFLNFFSNLGSPEWFIWAGSTELAVINNFVFNNLWTFKKEKITGLIMLINKFLQFNFTSIGALLIQTIFGTLGVIVFGAQYRQLLLPFIIVFMVLPYNYFIYNRIIWKTHKNAKK